MTETRRLTSEERCAVIVQGAIAAMKRFDTIHPRYENVAKECEVPTSVSTIRHYFANPKDLRVAAARIDETIAALVRERGLGHELSETSPG